MKTRAEKIKAIYKKIADKNLSFWCKIERQWNYYTVIEWRHFIYEKTWKYIKTTSQSIEELSCESIWHPVMIWDVLDFCIWNKELNSKRLMWQNTIFWLLNRWKEKRKPIEEQSEECIDYIYNLIFEKW